MTSPVLVKHVMTSDVVTFFAEQTLPLAEDVMRIHRFRHLPVIDSDGHLVGLLTHRDLLRGQISVLTGLTESETFPAWGISIVPRRSSTNFP